MWLPGKTRAVHILRGAQMLRAAGVVPFVVEQREEQRDALLNRDGASLLSQNISINGAGRECSSQEEQTGIGIRLAVVSVGSSVVELRAFRDLETKGPLPPHSREFIQGQIAPRRL